MGLLMNEYEILDILWEALPQDGPVGASLYEQRENMTRPEMYIRINGECWRIKAEYHPHPSEA